MRIGIYVRVSTEEQKENTSINSQLKDCHKRAKKLNASEVIEYVDDGYSGAFLDRPGMNELREDIKEKKVDIIICYDPDRFARKLVHQLLVTEEIEKSGATIEFINSDYKDTPEGKLFYSIRGAFSEFEREKIRERSIRGKRAKAEAGKIVFNNHPYGYNYDKVNSVYIINEEEAEMVRKIFKWYTEGDEEGNVLGLLAIAEKLVLYEYPTRTGIRSWSTSSINGIITNELYTGTAWAFKTYKRKIGPKKYEKGIRPPEEWVPISVPPIIDQLTFDKARAQAKLNSKLSNRNTKRDHLLRGLVHCPVCDSTLTLHHSRGYGYYRCQTGKSHGIKYIDGNQAPMCPVRTIPAGLLDELVWDNLVLIATNKNILAKTIKASQGANKKGTKYIGTQLEVITKHEAKVSVQKEKILKLYRQDLISEEDAEKELKEIKGTLFKLSAERRKLVSKSEIKDTKPLADRLKIFSMDFDSFEEKRIAVINVLEKVIAKRTDTFYHSKQGKQVVEFTIKFKV